MTKKKRTNRMQQSANAYKARQEGKAVIIKALTPVIITLIILSAMFMAPKVGVDLTPYADVLTAIPLLVSNQAPTTQP